MSNSSFQSIRKIWLFLAILPVLICAIPLIFVFVASKNVSVSGLNESFSYFSTDSVLNTFTIIFFVLLFSMVIGIGFAWLFSHYSFSGSRFFEWMMVLPIAIPGYIMAVTYSSFFDYGGYFYQFTGSYFNMMNMYGLIFVLAITLYPYIYINALNAFKLTSGNYGESARILGAGSSKYMFKILIPLAMPAIVAGAWLTIMETLNDFGAASYYGIRTISTEIIRCWQIDMSLTVFISLMVFLLVILSLFFVQRFLSRKGFYQASKSKPIERIRLKGSKNAMASALCALFFFVSFLLPVLILFAFYTAHMPSEESGSLLIRTWNSLLIAIFGATAILIFTIVASYNSVVNNQRRSKWINFIADFGYALPGAVLAIALIGVAVFFSWLFSINLVGTLFFLILSYFIRFYAVARQPVSSLFSRLPRNSYSASVNLGKSPLSTFFKVYFPLLWPGLLSIFLLVLIDILKELPVTLILRPFNFETLSTSVYGYAKVNESVQEASPYALIIILLGVAAVGLFMFVQRKANDSGS